MTPCLREPFDFTRFRSIVVTGPQRSGTHIAAEIIAADIGYTYVDDSEFGVINKAKFLWECHKERRVIHCPGMSRWIHEVPKGTLVVFMMRDLEDIHRSEARIKWNGRYMEQMNYGCASWDTAAEKYRFWREVQKPILGASCIEIEYESLKYHPLWVSKDRRSNFEWDQIDTKGTRKTIPIGSTMAEEYYADPYFQAELWLERVAGPPFPGFVEELKCVLEHMPYRPLNILDIGYGWGVSSAMWLTMIGDCQVTSIDPLDPGGYSNGMHVVSHLLPSCQKRWTFIKASAEEILPKMDTGQYDLVFLDSDHGGETSPWQIRAAWKCVTPGGILAGHDYFSCYDTVGMAVNDWAEKTGIEVRMERPYSREGVWWTEAKGEE
jgi:hypothetical protein